jgi:uncharacterized protein YbjT (DUF2867 family)
MTLLIAGATGLVGGAVLRQALADGRVARVVAPTRRALPPSPRLLNPIVDFEHLPADADWWAADSAVCALGTTIAKAGSREAFRRVDRDHVVAFAHMARRHGTRTFALTSAFGADAASRVFYNRVKGETEAAVAACGYPSLTIVRPGVIGGDRAERRPAESAAITVLGLLGPILPRAWRISPAEHIARALVAAAIAAEPGHHIVTSRDLA